jgi:hypothetical protein
LIAFGLGGPPTINSNVIGPTASGIIGFFWIGWAYLDYWYLFDWLGPHELASNGIGWAQLNYQILLDQIGLLPLISIGLAGPQELISIGLAWLSSIHGGFCFD